MDVDAEARQKIVMLERKVNFLIKHFGLEAEVDAAPVVGFEDVVELVKRGDKARAIQLYREKTGVGVADAMKAIAEMK